MLSYKSLALLAAVLVAGLFALASPVARAGDPPLFDPVEFLDESTLDVVVLDDWHVDTVNGTTRQKLIEINVAEWWPGQDFRMPVRLIVPLDGKATGFHITGGHAYGSFDNDVGPTWYDAQLIAGGVGVVQTVVRPIESLPGGAQLAQDMLARLLQTHDLRYTTTWIWPMTLMRAATAAYAETGHFEPGKIAGSGGSKNGYAPAAALINDERFTLTFSSAAPAYGSPLRMYDQGTMDEVTAANDWFFAALDAGQIDPGEHTRSWYVNKSFGAPDDLHVLALAAGWTWQEIRQLVEETRTNFYVADNWDQLMARGAEVFFQPGTHDWVAYDVLWGAQNHPQVPVYYQPNGIHDQTPHSAAETGVQNEQAVLLRHFLGGADPMLEPPSSTYEVAGDELRVSVTFDSGPEAESGRIWWMYDRYPGGSAPFLWERIPDDQWMDMTFDVQEGAWTATIPLGPAASTIEFFSNHGLVVDGFQTYLSSPYTRAELAGPGDTDGDGCPDVNENGLDETLGGLRDYKNPWDFYDIAGLSGPTPDGYIDLLYDILGVIQHYSPNGKPPYDAHYDRGPTAGPNAWNMTAPDGVIDLLNDILGVIQQYSPDCR
ncbi:MAG: hypothetical protein IIB87_06060 [Chloroflexi bacterium]|nr:hypothetical protein [Chloroflexota bacterium]